MVDSYINFNELLWNYEIYFLRKLTSTGNQTFLRKFYTTKIWSYMVSYIALLPGQYLDIAREGGQYPDIAGKVAFNYFDPPFDPTFHL